MQILEEISRAVLHGKFHLFPGPKINRSSHSLTVNVLLKEIHIYRTQFKLHDHTVFFIYLSENHFPQHYFVLQIMEHICDHFHKNSGRFKYFFNYNNIFFEESIHYINKDYMLFMIKFKIEIVNIVFISELLQKKILPT